ncbi:MAG TPA: hypothetical protein VG320_24550 [Paraburkholderia sp.]|uniref:hypothetical protein n=1 Tax=Paraburkholderia sp. TaxID=1926495 RepID=UPI002DF395E8|nr:hypothetical protein [Paraburkholderia sp.]
MAALLFALLTLLGESDGAWKLDAGVGCVCASSRAALVVSATRASSARSLHALVAHASQVVALTNNTPGRLKRLRDALQIRRRAGTKSTVIEVSVQIEAQQRLEEAARASP